MAKFRAIEEGEGRWFDYGTDHQKPVRLRVRALTQDEERGIRHRVYGNRKTDKLQKESFLRTVDRGEMLTRERAVLALEDSQNFNVALAGPKATARFAELLGPEYRAQVDIRPGAEVCLDGRWTPELKAAFFSEFPFSKGAAREVSDFCDQVARCEEEDEEETVQGFSPR